MAEQQQTKDGETKDGEIISPKAPLDFNNDIDMSQFERGASQAVVKTDPGELLINFQHGLITAQQVAVRRDYTTLETRLRGFASQSGCERYVYQWEVKDKNRGLVTIQGPTIKLANDLLREYGNCLVDVRVEDHNTHFLIFARFVDLESGTSQTRPFRQRKNPDSGGRMNADRALDIALQTGVSKAIRNVVCNCLGFYADLMVDEALKNFLKAVKEHPDRARAFIEKMCKTHNVPLSRVEAFVGTKLDKMTIQQLARFVKEFQAIDDGFQDASDLYPSPEQIAERNDIEAAAAEAAAQSEGERTTTAETADEKKEKAAAKKKAREEAKKKKAAEDAEAGKKTDAQVDAEAKAMGVGDAEGQAEGEGEPTTPIPGFLDRSKEDAGDDPREEPTTQQTDAPAPAPIEPDDPEDDDEEEDALGGFE